MLRYYVSPRRRFARAIEDSRCADVHIPVDVVADDDGYTLTAYVPGVKAEDVKIEVLEDVISISGEFPTVDEEANYLLKERPTGEFSRKLRMPTTLDASKAEAEVVNGVLNLRVAKAEEAKAKQIKIKAK